jgi:hypothetical protein
MSTDTLPDILTQVRAVLEASPLALTAAAMPFSEEDDLPIPCARAYWIEPGPSSPPVAMGGYMQARLETVEVRVSLRAEFAEGNPEAMLFALIAIGRALVSDGDARGYHVTIGNAAAKYRRGREYTVGTLAVTVDYDFSEV